jgi:hypothetical protein
METSHQATFGDRPTTQFDALASLIRQYLGEMSNTQTLLSSTRKELLIERERVKTAAGEVRQKRVNAGNAEARFMNHVREFVNNHLEQLPSTLLEAYDKVRETRDGLGEAEADYLQDEEDLTGAEWMFMNRENRFYQFDINRILSSPQLINPAFPQVQPSETVSKPPIHDLPPCPVGSLSPSQVSKLPPPPPPPHIWTSSLPLMPHVSMSASLLAPIGREHPAVKELKTLRREFGKLSQRESYDFEWAGENGAFLAEEDKVREDQVTASTSDNRDVLLDIFNPEAKAQETKMEELDLALNESIPTRRYSDSTHLFSSKSSLSAPIRRTQTERATPFNRCSPATGNKIREWSLTHLKQSAVQKRLYLNALEDNGIDSSAEVDWRVRATRFWSKDSLSEIRDSSELYAASLSKVSYEPGSCDVSSTQSITSSLLMHHQLEGNIQPPKLTTVDSRPPESHEIPRQDCEDGPTIPPLSPTPPPSDRITERMEARNQDQIVSPIKSGLNERQHLLRGGVSSDTGIHQPKCTCLAIGDMSPRKDSVQSTHQPGCDMATEHDGQNKTSCSAQEHDDAASMTEVTMMDRHSDRTHQSRSVDLHPSLPPSSDYGKIVCNKPNLDITAHSDPPGPCAPLTPLPATAIKGALSPTANQITPNPRPTPQARRNTITWFRSLFPHSKNKRSKSSPSIGEYHPTTHV